MSVAEGSTAVYVAICMPVILLMLIFLTDATGSFVLRARLQDIADASADAGMATLADLIVKKAEANEPNPPPNADPLLYLTPQDVQALLVDPAIDLAVHAYVEKNKNAMDIPIDNVHVTYPTMPVDCSDPSKKVARLNVQLVQNYPFLFPSFFGGKDSTSIITDAIQFMKLCP